MQTMVVKEKDWVVANDIKLDYLRIYPKCHIVAPEGKTVTMLLNGHPERILPGEYKGDIQICVREALTRPFVYNNNKEYTYRVAAHITDNKIQKETSVLNGILSGNLEDTQADKVVMTGNDPDFNGIIVDGNSEYKITNTKIDFLGNGSNDFMGMGFGIMARDQAKVLIEDCDIHTKGVVRGTVYAGDDAVLTMRYSTIFAETTDEMPIGYKQHIGLGSAYSNAWVLGTLGTCRATFFTDRATVNIENCICKSQGWGVLSIDMPQQVRMNVKDSEIYKTGESAYGAFSIGNTIDTFDNCNFSDITYAMIMASNEASGVFKNHTRVNAQIGVIVYRNYQGTLDIVDKCVFHTDKAGICIKGSSSYIRVKDSEFYPKNGVLLQVMDNDEQPNADGYYEDPLGEEDVLIEGRDITEADPTEDVMVEFSDMTINDNIFNASTNLFVNQRCPQFEMPWQPPEGPKHHGFGADLQGAKNLDIVLNRVICNGQISASIGRHASPLLTSYNYYEIGVVTNTVKEPVNNGVIVHLNDHSVWNVPDECWITGLHIDETSAVKAPEGKTLVMTVDGKETTVQPGVYKGKIHFSLS